MKILKISLKIFLVLNLFIISLTFAIMYTHVGSKLAWNIVQKNLDFLSGDMISGSLGSGFVMENFHLDLGFLDLKIDHLENHLDLSHITSLKVRASEVIAGNIEMKLNFEDSTHNSYYDEFKLQQISDIWAGDKKSEPKVTMEEFVLSYIKNTNEQNLNDKNEPFYVNLPIDINLDSFKAQSYNLESSLFKLKLKNIHTRAGLSKHLIYGAQVYAEDVDFYLKDTIGDSPSPLIMPEVINGFDKNEVAEKITTLPTVYIPFDIEIASADFRNARYHMNGYDTEPLDIFMRGIIHQSQISITDSYILSSQYGNFILTGDIKLEDYLHLNAEMEGVCQYGILGDDLKGIPVKASVKGQLSDMHVGFETKDSRKISAKGRLNVLDGILTSELDLKYNNVTWPLVAKSYHQKKGKNNNVDENNSSLELSDSYDNNLTQFENFKDNKVIISNTDKTVNNNQANYNGKNIVKKEDHQSKDNNSLKSQNKLSYLAQSILSDDLKFDTNTLTEIKKSAFAKIVRDLQDLGVPIEIDPNNEIDDTSSYVGSKLEISNLDAKSILVSKEKDIANESESKSKSKNIDADDNKLANNKTDNNKDDNNKAENVDIKNNDNENNIVENYGIENNVNQIADLSEYPNTLNNSNIGEQTKSPLTSLPYSKNKSPSLSKMPKISESIETYLKAYEDTPLQNLKASSELPMIEASSGTLHYKGNLNEFKLKLKTEFSYLENHPFIIAINAEGLYSDFNIEELRVYRAETPDHDLKIDGNFLFGDNEFALNQLNINASHVPLDYLLGFTTNGDLTGNLKGNTTYNLKDEKLFFNLDNTNLNGQLLTKVLKLSGKALGNIDFNDLDNSTVTFNNLGFSYGKTDLKIDGALLINGDSELDINFNTDDLYELTRPFISDPINGKISFEGHLWGTLNAPNIKVTGEIPKLSLDQDFSLTQLKFNIDEKININSLSFTGKSDVTLDELSVGDTIINNIKLNLSGDQNKHNLIASVNLPETLKVDTKLEGSLDPDSYKINLKSLSLDTPLRPWILKNNPNISYSFKEGKVSFGRVVLVNNSNVVNINPGHYVIPTGEASVHGKITKFHAMKLVRYLPENVIIGAEFNGTFDFDKESANAPIIVNAHVESKNGRFTNSLSSTEFKKMALDFSFNSAKFANGSFLLDADKYGSVELRVDYNLNSNNVDDKVISLNIKDFQLELIDPLVPKLDLLQGRINTKGVIKQDRPNGHFYYNGKLVLDNGRLVTEADIASLDKINLSLDFDKENVKVEGSFSMGTGEAKIKGDLNIQPIYEGLPPLGEIVLTADKLNVNLAGYGTSLVDYHVTLNFASINGEDKLIIRGDIKIPQSKIIIKTMESSGVSLSDDVVVVETRSEEDIKQTKKINVPPYVDYDITVTIGDDVTMKGYGLSTALRGSVNISNNTKDKSLALMGTVNLDHGRFKSFGQNLIIRLGKIDFVGDPKDTSAVMEAIRDPESISDGSGVVVGVRVIRTLSKMDMKVFSSPEMSEQEKLSYLLNGTSLSDDGDTGSSSAAATGMLLNASLSGASMAISDVVQDIGINNFQLETTGSGSSSQVSASANLTDKLKVSYGYGLFDAVGEFKVRYQILSRLFIQFVNRTDQAVDLFYSFSID